MKKIITVMSVWILSLPALAQHDTLQNPNTPEASSDYGGSFSHSFPEIICPGETTLETDAGTCQTLVKGDGLDVKVKTNAKHRSLYKMTNSVNGDSTLAAVVLPKGTTTITWTVKDTSGHTEQCSFEVIVADREAPRLRCPSDQGRVIEFSEWKYYTVAGKEFDLVDFSDNCPGIQVQNDYNALVTLDAAVVPEGVTRITWTGMDADGNAASCSYAITVLMK